jgi:hypothetical protein
MFGFLNRWNDSMGTPIEPVARKHDEANGRDWEIGKHSGF